MATTAPPWAPPTSADHRANISRVSYMPGLDGMRAIAVVAVMVYHANSDWLAGGFLGVEMFFVISGYLITLLLISERERTYRISLKEFWIRRARRLLPALFLMMGMLAVWTALFRPESLGQLRGDVLAGLFYVSNWYQIWVGLDYTAAADFAPLRHLWSLAVEEQFYLLWPLVMVVFLRRNGTRSIAGVSRWLFGAAVVITVLVGLLYHPGPVGDPAVTPEAYWFIGDRPISKLDALYLSTPSRAAALLLGAALAMVWRPLAISRGPLAKKGRAFDALALGGLVVFVLMCWNVYLVTPNGTADSFLFRGGFFVASLATLGLIAGVTHPAAAAGRLLGNRVFLWIGTRSYGLYLYHWPIYQLIRDVAGNKLNVSEFVFAMFVTAIVTELSYRFVETPIRTGRFKAMIRRVRSSPNPSHRRALAAGVAAALALTMFAGATLATAELQQNEIAEQLEDSEEFTTDLAGLADGDGPPPQTLPPTVPPESAGSAGELSADAVPAVVPVTTEEPILVPVVTIPDTTIPVGTVADSTVPEPVAPDSTVVDSTQPEPVEDPVVADSTVPDSTVPDSIVPDSTVPDSTVPPSTEPPIVVPATTLPPPPPPTQLGVVTNMATVRPLLIPPTTGTYPLVALGDSVMLGAAEELGARGFLVDAVKSRGMLPFLPDLQAIRDSGALGSVVVVHLGTNGGFSQETLDSMMALLADVPIVIAITAKADRAWTAANNEKTRALAAAYPHVTVLDWEVLSQGCPDGCFYSDGIHLTQAGQNYYAGLIARVLGLA